MTGELATQFAMKTCLADVGAVQRTGQGVNFLAPAGQPLPCPQQL